MATFYVKTQASLPSLASVNDKPTSPFSRSLVIEADKFETSPDFGTFDFYREHLLVASVPSRDVLAVVEEDAYQGDYLFDLETEPDDSDDVCLDCRFKEFLESEEFFNEVYEIVEAYHGPDDYGDVPDPLPEPLTIYKAITPDYPNGAWGFWYNDDTKGDVFVPFGISRTYAETGLVAHIKGTRWPVTTPLDKTTAIPETIQ